MNMDEKKQAALRAVQIPDEIRFDPVPEEPVPLRRGQTLLRVSSSTNVPKLSTAIARFVQEGEEPVLSCIGAGAISQGTKATIRANGVLATRGLALQILPAFSLTQVDGRADLISSVRLYLKLA